MRAFLTALPESIVFKTFLEVTSACVLLGAIGAQAQEFPATANIASRRQGLIEEHDAGGLAVLALYPLGHVPGGFVSFAEPLRLVVVPAADADATANLDGHGLMLPDRPLAFRS